jgi:hypothetical protein
MALINKTGIANSNVIQAEHVTRAIDALSGGSTDTVIATGSFSGSLVGTSSFATSASFATTTNQNTATLTFFHNQVTDTTGSRVSYIGGFAAPPYDTAARIALHVPFTGTITHCVVSSFASTPAASPTTTLTCALSVDGGSTYPVDLGTLNLSQFIDDNITILNTAVTAGDKINIRLTEITNSNAVWGINAVLILKS